MKKIIGDFPTNVEMTTTEAKEICKLGQGDKCCAFLAADGNGFSCIRMDYPMNSTILTRLEDGTMNAKGRGGWEGCAWEGSI